MMLNIITPCSRPYNLDKIAESINFPSYRWIVVFDAVEVPTNVPHQAECYALVDKNSTSGNAQRNYALDIVEDGWVYFNDDDTVIHPELWKNIQYLNNDFISFKQAWPSRALRLQGNNITPNNIDSHNFILHNSLIGDTRWVLHEYGADGIFANECYKRSKSPIYIDQVLSVYNTLR